MSEKAAAAPTPLDGIDGTFAPLPRSDLTSVVLEGETVVLVEGAPSGFYLDQLATLVWDTFDGAATLDELAEDFAEAFGADLEVIRNDIVSLTRAIANAGLLSGISVEPRPMRSGVWDIGVGVGEPIPPFRLPGIDGAELTIDDLVGHDVLLVNWSPTCGFCTRIAPELAELQSELDERGVRMVFITVGDEDANRPLLEAHGLRPTVLFAGESETDVFSGAGTPAAYFVDSEGRAASELTIGADKVPILARSAAGR